MSVVPLLEPAFADDGTEMIVEVNFSANQVGIGESSSMQDMLSRANALEEAGQMKEAAELVARAMESAALGSKLRPE